MKYTPQQHPEYSQIADALNKIEQVVSYINENKKVVEDMEALAAILKTIDNFPNVFFFFFLSLSLNPITLTVFRIGF